MQKPIAPCKGCTPETGRSADPNCHTTCERYIEYQKEREIWNEIVRTNKENN